MTDREVLRAILEIASRKPKPITALEQAKRIVEIRQILRHLKGTIQ